MKPLVSCLPLQEMETYKFKETSLHLIEGLNSTLGTSLDKFHIPLQGL
jgi:hypothetical protein